MFFRDAATSEQSIGQHVELTRSADKIDSSPLTVEVDTPDGQHALRRPSILMKSNDASLPAYRDLLPTGFFSDNKRCTSEGNLKV
jgi:hypothetical protein